MRTILVVALAVFTVQANAGLKLKQRMAKIYIDKDGKQISPIQAHKLALATDEPILECQQVQLEADEFTGKMNLKKVK